jgi:hypothetical protein
LLPQIKKDCLGVEPSSRGKLLGLMVLLIAYISLLFVSLIIILVKVKLKIKFTFEQVMKAQRGSRDIALHFL